MRRALIVWDGSVLALTLRSGKTIAGRINIGGTLGDRVGDTIGDADVVMIHGRLMRNSAGRSTLRGEDEISRVVAIAAIDAIEFLWGPDDDGTETTGVLR